MPPRSKLQDGDVIGFVAHDWYSTLINIGTFGVPGVSCHHVGIVFNGLVYESAESERPPCHVTSKKTKGVQAHPVWELSQLSFYDKIWRYPLRSKLYPEQAERLGEYLNSKLGTSYDMRGAIHSGGKLIPWIYSRFHPEDTNTLFCSELVCGALVDIGVLKTDSVSMWNPNAICRYLVRHGIYGRPDRLK